MITFGSGIAAWFVGKFGVALVCFALAKAGVPGFVARAVSPMIAAIGSKLIRGQAIAPAEQAAWLAHVNTIQPQSTPGASAPFFHS